MQSDLILYAKCPSYFVLYMQSALYASSYFDCARSQAAGHNDRCTAEPMTENERFRDIKRKQIPTFRIKSGAPMSAAEGHKEAAPKGRRRDKTAFSANVRPQEARESMVSPSGPKRIQFKLGNYA